MSQIHPATEFAKHLRLIAMTLLITAVTLSLVDISSEFEEEKSLKTEIDILRGIGDGVRDSKITSSSHDIIGSLSQVAALEISPDGHVSSTIRLDDQNIEISYHGGHYQWSDGHENTAIAASYSIRGTGGWGPAPPFPTVAELVSLWNGLDTPSFTGVTRFVVRTNQLRYIPKKGDAIMVKLTPDGGLGHSKSINLRLVEKESKRVHEATDENGTYQIDVDEVMATFRAQEALLDHLDIDNAGIEYGPFNISFPIIASMIQGSEEEDIRSFTTRIRSDINAYKRQIRRELAGDGNKIQVLGSLQIPTKSLALLTFVLMISIQTYFLVHLNAVKRVYDSNLSFPWIGLFPGWPNRIILWLILIAVPCIPPTLAIIDGFAGSSLLPRVHIGVSVAIGIVTARVHWGIVPLRQESRNSIS